MVQNLFPMQILREFTRLYPFNYFRGLLLRHLPSVPSFQGAIRCRKGLKFCSLHAGEDHISKSLFWLGDFDPWVIALLVIEFERFLYLMRLKSLMLGSPQHFSATSVSNIPLNKCRSHPCLF
jgi:hypothetical protein